MSRRDRWLAALSRAIFVAALAALAATAPACNRCSGVQVSGSSPPASFARFSAQLDGRDVSPKELDVVMVGGLAGAPGFSISAPALEFQCPDDVDLNHAVTAPLDSFCPHAFARAFVTATSDLRFPLAGAGAAISVVASSGNFPVDTQHLPRAVDARLALALQVPAVILQNAEGHQLQLAVSQLLVEDDATYEPASFACPSGGGVP
ncbi:MAG TPA: hypothetical protein VFF06_14100 [Polyangia bacterium]|nr:hypothetical protein [Polyangia bacterium]